MVLIIKTDYPGIYCRKYSKSKYSNHIVRVAFPEHLPSKHLS